MTQNFTISPARPVAILTLVTIAVMCCLLAAVVAVGLHATPVVAWPSAMMCVALGGLFAWFALAQRWSSVEVIDRRLDVRLPLYSRSFSIDQIVAGSPAKVHLPHDGKHRLTWRINGLSVGGYHIGWFRTEGASKVLAAVTGPDAVAWTTNTGEGVLLSMADADAFLQALKQASPTR